MLRLARSPHTRPRAALPCPALPVCGPLFVLGTHRIADLIAETSAACFDRNRPFVQGKLQERELSKLSYGRSGSAKPIAIGAAPGSMLVSI